MSLLEFLDVLVPGVLGPGCVGIFGDTESRNNLAPPVSCRAHYLLGVLGVLGVLGGLCGYWGNWESWSGLGNRRLLCGEWG